MVYKQTKINITRDQLHKAINGKQVRFSKGQLGTGPHHLSLHPANRKIVEKAVLKGTGCCLSLAPGELFATVEDMGGQGFFGDIYKGLKSAYNWTKKNVIDSDIYQQALKPVVRGFVDQGSNILKTAVPQLAPAIDMAKNELSKTTGAFGLKRTKAQRVAMLKASGLYLS